MMEENISTLVNIGAAGAVIAVVIIFLRFIDKRDTDWRAFFDKIRVIDAENNRKMTDVIDKLVTRIESLEDKFDRHDATEMEFLRGVASQESKTRPRKPGAGD